MRGSREALAAGRKAIAAFAAAESRSVLANRRHSSGAHSGRLDDESDRPIEEGAAIEIAQESGPATGASQRVSSWST
jgi:hypothetical protein